MSAWKLSETNFYLPLPINTMYFNNQENLDAQLSKVLARDEEESRELIIESGVSLSAYDIFCS